MPVEWTPDLSVGIEVIDEQHKEIFARAATLIEATRRGSGREELVQLIRFLEQYVVEHFAMEEQYMLQYGYGAYSGHKAEHEGFKRDFADLKNRYDVYGATSELVMLTERRTAFWLKNHIGRVDRALGAFLKSHLAQDRQ